MTSYADSQLGRRKRLLFDSLLMGLVGGASARAFIFLLHLSERVFLYGLAHYRPPGLPEEGGVLSEVVGAYGLWLIPIATTLGGLIAGLLVFRSAPEAEGDGIDTVVEAFHHRRGSLRTRVPFIKMMASVLTIGSGGAAGWEGPTALVAAGIGSIYAAYQRRTGAD